MKYNGYNYTLSDDIISLGDWVLAEYTNGDIRIFKLKNKYSDYNNFYSTNNGRLIYKKIISSNDPCITMNL